MGADYEFKYSWGYPPLINNRYMFERVYKAMENALGDKAIILDAPVMASEDC